jgi:type VI secretion system protein VasD
MMMAFRLKALARPVLMLGLMLTLVACGSTPPKADKVRMTVAATADVNPAADGRASPIVLRIYQLKDGAKFSNVDFFTLFDNEQQALGGDLLSREEVELTPGEKRELNFMVAGDAKYVGVLAAYRDIRNAQWRTVQASPKSGLKNLVKKDAISISAGRTAVTLTIKE